MYHKLKKDVGMWKTTSSDAPAVMQRTFTMIGLHCHLLPGIDDGSPGLATTLEMARIAVADGIEPVACTPHIYPGLYENTGPSIAAATALYWNIHQRR